ncbi:hypothetical protein KA005_55515 [bacterium]|nr:hypothetical protein [bacterium]
MSKRKKKRRSTQNVTCSRRYVATIQNLQSKFHCNFRVAENMFTELEILALWREENGGQTKTLVENLPQVKDMGPAFKINPPPHIF